MRDSRLHLPRRRPTIADVLTTVLLIAALVVWTGTSGLAEGVLTGLTVVLVGWPVGVIALAGLRWGRQGDWRYVGAAGVLVVAAAASIGVGLYLVS